MTAETSSGDAPPAESEERVQARAALLDGYVEALERGKAPGPEAYAEQQGVELDEELRGQLAVLESLFGAARSIQLDASIPATVAGRAEGKRAPTGGAERRFLESGTKLGECEIEMLLGYGGMGEVYRAHHAVLGKDVAIKVMRPVLAEDPSAIQRFREEVQSIARLGAHPHVVAAMHASEHEGRLFLVMEYVPGGDLQQLVASEGPLEPALARRYVREAAAGLRHAHDAGLVHRDVKPSNLLVDRSADPDGIVKVVDLGLARLVMDGDRSPRWADELVGSLDYMAPEQADDPNAADARSDLYALGCTLYFLLAGAPPFAERLTLKKLMAHATQVPAPLDVPEGLRRVLDRLLAKDPDERFQTAAELIDALDALDSDWAPDGERRPDPPKSANDRTEGEPGTAEPPAAGYARLAAWGFGLLFALTLAALLVVLSRPPTEAPAPEPPPRTLGVGEPIEGALGAEDERLPKTGGFLDAYPLELEAGRTYVMTLRSRAFDPSLILRSDRGWEMATNDDAPGLGGAAQIVWRAEEAASVELVATSEEAREGAYVIDVTPLDAPKLEVGPAVEGELGEGSLRFHADGTPMDRYWLPVTVGETYVVEMRSESFRPATFVMSDDGTVIEAGDRLSETASRVVYTATETGFVYLVANVAEEGAGPYALELQNVEMGEVVFDQTGLLTEGDARARDESFYDPYPLEVEAGRTYVIAMESEDFDTYLLLVDEADARIARNDDAIGTDSRLVWRAPATQSLRVFANSYAPGMTGEYRIRARALPRPGGDEPPEPTPPD